MAKSAKTVQLKNPGRKIEVWDCDLSRSAFLWVPWSIDDSAGAGCFSVGPVTFIRTKQVQQGVYCRFLSEHVARWIAASKIPDSWFVDLSQDVIEEHEA